MSAHIPEQQRLPIRNILKEKELWILIGLGILFFYRPVFFGETFFERDLYLHFFLRKRLLADFFQAHAWPLWDPYLHGGQSYIAELSNSVFYPTNILYLILPVVTAFNLNIVLHFAGGATGMYFAVRVLGLQPVSSLISGIVFGYCGCTLSLGNLLGLLMALPYIPLLIACWHLYLLERRRRWFFFSVILGMFQVFAGAPELNVLTLLLLLGWTLCYPYPTRTFWKRGLLWIFLSASIIGASSIQIFPTIEMILQSPRGQGLSFTSFSHWSLYPERLPELILPGFLGYPPEPGLPKEFYWWGTRLLNEPRPYIYSLYFGAVVILLAALGALRNKADSILPLRIRILLSGAFVVALLLSFGRFLPFFDSLYQITPLLHLFRHPVKFLLIAIFPIALLAGYGAQVSFGNSTDHARPTQQLLTILWGVLVMLLLLTAAFLFFPSFTRGFQELFFKQSGELIARGFSHLLRHASGIWLLSTLVFQARRFQHAHWQQWILASLLFLDLAIAGKPINAFVPQEFFTVEPESVPLIRQHIGHGRLYRFPQYPADFHGKIALKQVESSALSLRPLPSSTEQMGIILRVPSKDVLWLYRWDLEALHHYLAALYRLPVIFHEDYTQLAQARILTCEQRLATLPWEQRLPLLSAGAVTLILSSEIITVPGIELSQLMPNRSNLPLYLYRNTRAIEPVQFVSNWTIVESDAEALEMLRHPEFDPRTQVMLQPPPPSKTGFFEKTRFLTDAKQICQSANINTLHSSFSSQSAAISNDCDGVLVFSAPFDPGWQVRVDGISTPIWRANYAFSAVFLPAGGHFVERVYRPLSLILGFLATLGSWCLLIGIVCVKKNPGFFQKPGF